MTTNNPEVVAWEVRTISNPNTQFSTSPSYPEWAEKDPDLSITPLVSLNDYGVLRSECKKLVEALESVVSYDESAEDDDGNLMFHYSDMMRKVRAALSAHRRGGR